MFDTTKKKRQLFMKFPFISLLPGTEGSFKCFFLSKNKKKVKMYIATGGCYFSIQ